MLFFVKYFHKRCPGPCTLAVDRSWDHAMWATRLRGLQADLHPWTVIRNQLLLRVNILTLEAALGALWSNFLHELSTYWHHFASWQVAALPCL